MKYAILLIANISVILSSIAEYNPDWWKSIVLEPTPTNDLVLASSILEQQGDTIGFLRRGKYSSSDAIAATNLWTMLAILHGDLREKKIENPPPVFRNFGIITNKVELQRREVANQEAMKIRDYQSSRWEIERRIRYDVFVDIAPSEALASFPVQERNAIVSNIVELARLTTDEAAELGLTNVVESVGE